MGATVAQINKHIWGHVGSLTCLVACQVPSWASEPASHPGCLPGAKANVDPLWAGDTSSGHGTGDRETKTSHGASSPSGEVHGSSIYNRHERTDGYRAVVICYFSRTQTRGIWQKQREKRKKPSAKPVVQEGWAEWGWTSIRHPLLSPMALPAQGIQQVIPLSFHFPHHQLLNPGGSPSVTLHGHKATGDAAVPPRPLHGVAARVGRQGQMMGEQVREGDCPHLSQGQAPCWLP